MYRTLLPMLVCISTISSAPQDDIYIQPPADEPLQSAEAGIETIIKGFGDDTDTTSKYEDTADFTTDKDVEDLTRQTDEYESHTSAPYSPKFHSKLSYFKKSKDASSSASNLLDYAGRRKFRSNCRCSKIWNCPKLQITVPRCPEEYFMCCFN